jgi:hypothetical protein
VPVERRLDRLRDRPELVRRESQYVRANRIELIAADVPFVAGDVAEAAGVRAVAVSNFTWDWIYDPWFGREHPDLIETIRASYAKFHSILHMPFLPTLMGWSSCPRVSGMKAGSPMPV